MDRRTLILRSAFGGLALTASSSSIVSAQRVADKILTEAGPLPERVFGSPNAKVTVVEYASLTCHHCRDFHIKTWPAIKARYVDTGKVRFILREFPLDQVALGGAMLARCAKDDNWYEVVDTLYGQDGEWAHATSPLEGLRGLLTKSLMSNAQFEACLSDQGLQDKITSVARGGTIAGVTSTPTFFINGKKYQGYMTPEIFGQILDNLL